MLLAICKKKDYDITVDALSLAQAREGPSAGITILVGMVSALTKRPVRCDVAMTCEVTVLGKILPVGAVQEKVIAAAEAGIKRVYVPAENEKDVLSLPQEIKDRVDIKLVSRVEEVLDEVLLDYKIEEEHGDEHSAEKRDVASYLLVEDLERALRECIRTRLEKISENWWKERIPPDVRENTEKRREMDALKKDLIGYIDFPDYIKIITRKDNWRDCFKEVFGSEETLRAKMQELEPIRNSVMHSRPITEEEKKKLELYAREITNEARSASS